MWNVPWQNGLRSSAGELESRSTQVSVKRMRCGSASWQYVQDRERHRTGLWPCGVCVYTKYTMRVYCSIVPDQQMQASYSMLPLQTLRERAYRQIRVKLAAGDFPPGTAVPEPTLAKELGMSRTPVREAIRQMEVAGLLRYVPSYGAMVRTPDRGELDEMHEVRELLECRAAELAVERITDADLEELGGLLQKMQEVTQAFLGSQEELLAGDHLHSSFSWSN